MTVSIREAETSEVQLDRRDGFPKVRTFQSNTNNHSESIFFRMSLHMCFKAVVDVRDHTTLLNCLHNKDRHPFG